MSFALLHRPKISKQHTFSGNSLLASRWAEARGASTPSTILSPPLTLRPRHCSLWNLGNFPGRCKELSNSVLPKWKYRRALSQMQLHRCGVLSALRLVIIWQARLALESGPDHSTFSSTLHQTSLNLIIADLSGTSGPMEQVHVLLWMRVLATSVLLLFNLSTSRCPCSGACWVV